MRDAKTILGIIRARGRQGLPLEDVYRQLYNPELYLLAYAKIAQNKGAMTPGVTAETADGMSLEKVQTLIETLRCERYRWRPVRRLYIEKKNSVKKRPLGIPTWSNKVLQEVMRLILEAYYEPQFSDHSVGFRPGLGCHDALQRIYYTWRGTIWFIEGDISSFFDKLDHQILLAILREKIHDNRFIRLIENLLRAGYLEEWRFHETLSGSPQGGIVSPVLANIYLDRLDQFVEQTLLPEFTRGTERASNPAYNSMTAKVSKLRRRGRHNEAKALAKQVRATPSRISDDPDFRRLKYVRYADDLLLGFIGTRSEAEEIKERIGVFLRDQLKLELSESKTLLTHATSESARFLGYQIRMERDDQKRNSQGNRTLNAQPTLELPKKAIIKNKSRLYMRGGIPMHRTEMLNDHDFSIVAHYQSVYRGVVNYYRMALNLRDLSHLKWIMETSLTKTLAAKHRLSVRKVMAKYGARVTLDNGKTYKVLRVEVPRDGKPPLVAQWGGIPLERDVTARLKDDATLERRWNRRTDLIVRLLADTCELCGSHEHIEIHHIRRLRDLRKPGRKAPPQWVQVMAARQRKTLVLCHSCHSDGPHHAGTRGTVKRPRTGISGEPGAVKVASPVRRGVGGKGARR
jgi:group II intron reverse transcriptase/maturase